MKRMSLLFLAESKDKLLLLLLLLLYFLEPAFQLMVQGMTCKSRTIIIISPILPTHKFQKFLPLWSIFLSISLFLSNSTNLLLVPLQPTALTVKILSLRGSCMNLVRTLVSPQRTKEDGALGFSLFPNKVDPPLSYKSMKEVIFKEAAITCLLLSPKLLHEPHCPPHSLFPDARQPDCDPLSPGMPLVTLNMTS